MRLFILRGEVPVIAVCRPVKFSPIRRKRTTVEYILGFGVDHHIRILIVLTAPSARPACAAHMMANNLRLRQPIRSRTKHALPRTSCVPRLSEGSPSALGSGLDLGGVSLRVIIRENEAMIACLRITKADLPLLDTRFSNRLFNPSYIM